MLTWLRRFTLPQRLCAISNKQSWNTIQCEPYLANIMGSINSFQHTEPMLMLNHTELIKCGCTNMVNTRIIRMRINLIFLFFFFSLSFDKRRNSFRIEASFRETIDSLIGNSEGNLFNVHVDRTDSFYQNYLETFLNWMNLKLDVKIEVNYYSNWTECQIFVIVKPTGSMNFELKLPLIIGIVFKSLF